MPYLTLYIAIFVVSRFLFGLTSQVSMLVLYSKGFSSIKYLELSFLFAIVCPYDVFGDETGLVPLSARVRV